MPEEKVADGVGPTPAVSDRARRLYKLPLDDLYDAVYFVDPGHSILYWNHAAQALSGYPASKVLGRRCSDNVLGHVDETGLSLCKND